MKPPTEDYRIKDFVNTQRKVEDHFADKTEDPFDMLSRDSPARA